MNLVQGLQAANQKSREFLEELDMAAKAMGYDSADGDPGLAMSKAVTQAIIDQAEAAIGSGDLMAMLRAAGAHGLGEKESG